MAHLETRFIMHTSIKEDKEVGKSEPPLPENSAAPKELHNNRNFLGDKKLADLFRKFWLQVTDDNNLTLYGFRRFRTAQLLNLRFLEQEIGELDHQIYQAGMKLGHTPSSTDRLGLRYGKRDVDARGVDEVVNQCLVARLHELLQKYGTYQCREASIFD